MGSLQSHKLKCEKRKTSDFVDVEAQVGRSRLAGAQAAPSKGNSHHAAAANRCPARMLASYWQILPFFKRRWKD